MAQAAVANPAIRTLCYNGTFRGGVMVQLYIQSKETKTMNLDFRHSRARGTARLFIAVLLLAAAAWGCGKDDGASPQRVPLTLQAQGVGSASQTFSAAALLSAATAQDTIPVTFTRALVHVRDVRFVFPDGDDDTDTLGLGDNDSLDADSDDGGQVRFRGPFVIDLLAGDAQTLGTQLVPAGIYTKIMGHLQSLQASGALATAYPELVGATVLLEGDIAGDGGGHFLYTARIDDEFIIHGRFSVLGDQPVTSFLVFDLSRLLTDRDGRFLDPRVTDNDQAIRQAIRHAIKVGIDADKDGEPDDDLESETD